MQQKDSCGFYRNIFMRVIFHDVIINVLNFIIFVLLRTVMWLQETEKIRDSDKNCFSLMTCNNCATVITRVKNSYWVRSTSARWMYNSGIVYLRIMAFPEHPIQSFHYREFGRATFIMYVKSPRSFSREIERSGLTRNIHSQSLLWRLTRFELPSSRKLRPLGAYFFCDTRDSG